MSELFFFEKVIHGASEISQKVTALPVKPGDVIQSPEPIPAPCPVLHMSAMAHVVCGATNYKLKNIFLSIFWHLVW